MKPAEANVGTLITWRITGRPTSWLAARLARRVVEFERLRQPSQHLAADKSGSWSTGSRATGLALAGGALGVTPQVLAEYVEHYNGHRPHRSLELRPPRGPTVIPAVTGGQVVRRTRMPGLINEYSRQAA